MQTDLFRICDIPVSLCRRFIPATRVLQIPNWISFMKKDSVADSGGSTGDGGGSSGGGGGKGDGDAGDDHSRQVSFTQRYLNMLEKEPLLTKACTSGTFLILTDIVAQLVVERRSVYDPLRTLRMSAIGFFLHGPSTHFWYSFIDGLFPGSSFRAVVSKLFMDQMIFAPLCIVAFFGLTNFKGSVSETVAKVKKEFLPTLISNWKIWPAAHLVNFRLVPPPLRTL
eukprot:CAMPEP_0184340786 /NCGR_PEP_ID=MMETSP1089-20130417/9429_1 /TAXON_ID=38269 ORGANISM="Gloeochaete wittrockiana, Strain SAG46.84" /NCGR_SAMPLE_ID=MMETSP1089 /ASSEMBLY_ACC=CAM_ASM_000445 /LENGTH=224 /DNA_ID=CAMNT_0026668745 /DNA_START=201 /DNA_END=872 /DNA_ORIENTATION=-